MATLRPEIDTIKKLRPAPTDGELHLLNFLKEYLSDDFEVYFQPFLNGDMPDIVIMRKGSGVFIIEVKDYNLDIYERGPSYWTVKTSQLHNARHIINLLKRIWEMVVPPSDLTRIIHVLIFVLDFSLVSKKTGLNFML